MADARSVVVRLSVDTAQAIRDSQQFGSEFERAMNRADSSAGRVDQSLNRVGSTAGRTAAGSVLALGAMAKAAVNWESQFAGVEKTVDGTATQMATLEDQLRELARTMPATHQEIAATAEAAGQLGVARDDIADFTETMIQLGETTNLTADEAATSIAQMANVLGTSQDDIDNVGAALVALGNDGASTEAQILGMAQRIAGAGAQIGLAESDILAIANAAASMGIEVEAGGSAISRVFTEMAKSTAQGGADLEQFAEVAGMSSQEFVRAFQDDPAQAFASFTAGLDRVNKSGGDVFTTLDNLGLSDIRVSQALLGMAASGDLLTDSLTLGAEAFEENSALAEEYAKRADTTAAEVQVAWNNIKDAGIEAGAALLPIISEVADDVSTLAQAFGDLPGPVQSSVTKLLSLTAIIGGATWFGTKVISGVINTRDALADLAAIAPRTATGLGRVAKAGAGITAIATAGAGIGSFIADLTGANLDVENLARNLEAVSNGLDNEVIGQAVDDLRIVTDRGLADGAKEATVEILSLNGAFGTFSTTLDAAQDDIDTIDQRLAELVEGGNAEDARKIFEGIVAEFYGLPAGSSVAQQAIDELIGNYDAYQTALDNAAASSSNSAGASGEAAAGVDEVADAASQASVSVGDLVDALDMLLNPKLNLAAATDQWRDGLRNLSDGLAENSKSLVGNTDAASQNRSAIRDQVSNLLDVVHAQAEAGAGTGKLTDTMKRGRVAILQAGEAAGISSEDMRGYLQVLGLTPKQIRTTVEALTQEARGDIAEVNKDLDKTNGRTAKPKVTAETRAALSAIQGVLNALNVLDGKTATTYITTRRVGDSPGYGPRTDSADGGTVPKTGLPYADRHPYMLADGEEVISNRRGQADRWRPLLKAINAGRLADGGTTGATRGVGPMSALYGISRNFLSPAELAGRLVNLTVQQLAQVGKDMDSLAKGPLAKLSHAFEKATALAEEELAASKDKLQSLKDERNSIAETVTSRLQTADLFARRTIDQVDIGNPTNGFESAYQARAWVAAQSEVSNFLAGPASSPVDLLRLDIARAREEREMIEQLRGGGLSGDALQYAIKSDGGLAGALDLSGRELRQFERLYDRRNEVTAGVGNFAGDAVLGREIREQTREVRAQREITQAIRTEARDTNRRLERLERLAEKAPRETGQEVGDAVDKAASRGGRNRR